MERREEEVQKLVTKASGIITKHICDQIDMAMTEFPQLKTVCSNCLVQVVHSRERLVHKQVYDVISHFHKAVPARRRQIIDHTEVFQTLLFRECAAPPEWEGVDSEDEDELEDEHGLQRKKDPSYEDQRKHHKGKGKGKGKGRRGRNKQKKKKPSPTAQFVKRYREGVKFALEDCRERGFQRVQAEDLYDAGSTFWPEDECAEIYWHFHKLLSRMPLDEERSADLQEVSSRLKIVLEDEQDLSDEDENDSLALSDEDSDEEAEKKLPEGWEEVQDQNGRTYFWNKETDETSWDRPMKSAAGKSVSKKKRDAKAQEDDGKAKGPGRRRTRVALGDVDDSEEEEEDVNDLLQLDLSFAKHVPTSTIRVMETRVGIPCYFMPLVTVNPPSIAIPEGMSMFFLGTSSQFRQVHFPLLDDQVLWQRRLGSFMAFACAYLWDRDNGMIHELVNVILQHLVYKLLLAFQRDVEQSIEIHSLNEEKAQMLLSENRRILMKRNMLETKINTVRSCIGRINQIE